MKVLGMVLLSAALVLSGCVTTGLSKTEESNVGVVEKVYMLFGQGDKPGFLGMLTPDCETILPGIPQEVPWAGTYVGADGFVQFLTTLSEHAQITGAEYGDFIAQGDKVIVTFREEKKSLSTGSEFYHEGVAIWTIKDGKIAGVRFYADTARIGAGLRGEL